MIYSVKTVLRLASAWAMARRSTVARLTRWRVAPAYAPIPDLIVLPGIRLSDGCSVYWKICVFTMTSALGPLTLLYVSRGQNWRRPRGHWPQYFFAPIVHDQDCILLRRITVACWNSSSQIVNISTLPQNVLYIQERDASLGCRLCVL